VEIKQLIYPWVMEIKQSMHMVEMTNQRRSKGRKASHKPMQPSKVGIPEFREKIRKFQ